VILLLSSQEFFKRDLKPALCRSNFLPTKNFHYAVTTERTGASSAFTCGRVCVGNTRGELAVCDWATRYNSGQTGTLLFVTVGWLATVQTLLWWKFQGWGASRAANFFRRARSAAFQGQWPSGHRF